MFCFIDSPYKPQATVTSKEGYTALDIRNNNYESIRRMFIESNNYQNHSRTRRVRMLNMLTPRSVSSFNHVSWPVKTQTNETAAALGYDKIDENRNLKIREPQIER